MAVATGNLPRALSSFVGRQDEVAELASALRDTGLLTLIGIGGVGKTRLALATAQTVRDRYAHGVWLVQLASVSDPSQVAAAVSAALGVRERPGSSPLQTLSLALRRRQLLLVLDNCEHVLQSSAELVLALLQECSDLTVLATSREPLGVDGEIVRAVPPLHVPDADASFDRLVESEAIQLLVARVQATDLTFALTPQSASVARHVCSMLDGLPLAIELVAARAKTMSLSEIAARLDDLLGLLTIGSRTGPARHQTLRATMDWSYELLTEPERVLARRLSIFSGGFTADAAVQVYADQLVPASQVVDVLDRLTSQSFISVDTGHERSRFHMLETVRQYGLERLEQAGETLRQREQHRDWCLSIVSHAPPEAMDAEGVAQLEPELANLRSALRWLIDTRQVAAAAQLALGMTTAWHIRGSFAEGNAQLIEVLNLASGARPPAELSHAGTWAAIMAANQGDFAQAERLALRGRELARVSGDAYAEAFAVNQLGWVAFLRGDVARARGAYEETLNFLAPTPGALTAVVRLQLALACVELGDHARAMEILERFAESNAGHGRSRFWQARLLAARARLAEQQANYVDADRLLDQAIAISRAVGDQIGLTEALTLRGTVAVERGERQLAADELAEALEIAALQGSKMRLAQLLEAIANLVASALPAACVQLTAAAEELRRALGAAPLPSERVRVSRWLANARRRLGEQAYADIWLHAQSLTLETALSEARQLLRSSAPHVAAPASSSGGAALSAREREVALLVTRGLTNRQIAETLVITRKTAETHVSHVLTKLGLVSRVQIATWGFRHGIVGADDEPAAG